MAAISSFNSPVYSKNMPVLSSDCADRLDLLPSNQNSVVTRTTSPMGPLRNENSHNSSYPPTTRSKTKKKGNLSVDSSTKKNLVTRQYSIRSQNVKNRYSSLYKLSNLIIRIEPIPNTWAIMYMKNRSDNDSNLNPSLSSSCPSQGRSSPMLSFTEDSSFESISTDKRSPSRLMSNGSVEYDTIHTVSNPDHQTSECHTRRFVIPSLERQSSSFDETNNTSENEQDRISQSSRRSCRSPVFTRRSREISSPMIDNYDDNQSRTSRSMALVSLDTNENLLPIEDRLVNELHIDHLPPPCSAVPSTSFVELNVKSNDRKRSRDVSPTDQIFNKRRYQRESPMATIQQQYCASYPIHIPRCIDCQSSVSSNLPGNSTGCRFQYCRKLKYLRDDRYKTDGFATAAQLQASELHSRANYVDQPVLNFSDAQYVLIQISKLYCSMFLHEQNERSMRNEKNIIWKRCVPGWREVCDECSTTLFNCHYMCQECGYMVCIECFDEYTHMTSDKRKKLKRNCTHWKSFSLAEFIPWKTLLQLRNNCVDYLSSLNIDYSIRPYHAVRNENLSTFLKTLKMKRFFEQRHLQKIWSIADCHYDTNIEFYCNGRLPVFNEWKSPNAKWFFRKVWSTSCPVLVKRVHKNLSPNLWHPKAFKEHMIDHCETPALWDCETLTPIQTNDEILTKFWDGFECLDIRLKDEENDGRPRILKLKDWPTKKDFASVFPTRLHDLMINIPFGDYTRRSYTYDGVSYVGGSMNIVERLPACLVKPDLGPKLYIAYSQLTSQASKKAGTTNLHVDVSDAVNVLVYVGIGGHGSDVLDKVKEIRQVEAEVLQSNIDETQLQRLRNGERPGALWHLFRSDDAKKIRDYLARTHRKIAGFDSIHDQTAYLEKDDLEKLKQTCNVESYPILQFLGDAVFIPSGAPHQVKNLHSCIKIAEDFVSPENLDRCLITTNEFRSLSKTHTNHADILQAKNILYYATRDAYDSLNQYSRNSIPNKSSASTTLKE